MKAFVALFLILLAAPLPASGWIQYDDCHGDPIEAVECARRDVEAAVDKYVGGATGPPVTSVTAQTLCTGWWIDWESWNEWDDSACEAECGPSGVEGPCTIDCDSWAFWNDCPHRASGSHQIAENSPWGLSGELWYGDQIVDSCYLGGGSTGCSTSAEVPGAPPGICLEFTAITRLGNGQSSSHTVRGPWTWC